MWSVAKNPFRRVKDRDEAMELIFDLALHYTEEETKSSIIAAYKLLATLYQFFKREDDTA